MPLNEPGTEASWGYLFGGQPPGKKNKLSANAAFRNLMSAQHGAYKVAKSISLDFQIGCSHFTFYITPYKNLPWNILAAKAMDYVSNYRFFKAFKNSCDFFGIQYYQPFVINLKWRGHFWGIFENKAGSREKSDLGWECYPEGMFPVLKKAAKNGKPIYITENGLADVDDRLRPKFIKEHLQYVHQAISDGVDVRGYLYWSLLDNFEFVELRGFWPRFGLIEVNYETQERKIRPSALMYADICKNNKIII